MSYTTTGPVELPISEFPGSDYYDRDLREIIHYMREFEKLLTHYAEVINTLSEAIVDIDAMKDAISALQVATSDLDVIRQDVSDLKGEYSSMSVHIENLYTQVALLKDYVDSENNIQDIHIEEYRIALQEEIDELRRIISEIDTDSVNPWHTELGKVHLAENFRLTYGDLADECPTAQEYAGLGLSANEYAEYELPAIEYCTRGKSHLHMYWVYSPAFGWKQEISNVLTSIVNFIKSTISATDYSVLDMTADEYASLDLTAEDYLSYGATQGYITISPSNIGLTKAQYERLGV